VLTLDRISKSYGGRTIFDNVSWSMPDDGRVGLVGLNGAGKSTLLKMIAGAIEPDSGRITRGQRTRVGYLAQDAPEVAGRPLLAETLSALSEMQALDRRRRELGQILAVDTSGTAHDAALVELGDVLSDLERHDFYTAESRAQAVLFGLGFAEPDLVRDVAEFSGGIRMRIALAKLLLAEPEFLMLDEPTNHLDIEARNWLEDYLENYKGGIILVSHDRYFLDRVTQHTVEVARGRLIEYQGGYSAYLAQREQRFQLELAAYEKQRAEIEHMENFISRFRYQASKAKLVQSRVKQLEKIERLESPVGTEKPPAINFPTCERGARRVFELKDAVKRFGALTVYDGIDLEIERGSRIALVGPNGSGKSTMMKLLAGIEALTAGERRVGNAVHIGYFAQDLSETLDYEKTVLEELSGCAEGMTAGEIRALLGAMLFSGDDALKRVGVLSGGERARLALAKVLARRNNCLLLDEPTNNLDIVAKDILLDALRRFPGTVVIVSHDRYILDQLVTQVIEAGHGQAVRYLGNYEDYLARKEAESKAKGAEAQTLAAGASQAASRADGSASSGNGRPEGNQKRADNTRGRDRDKSHERDRQAERRRTELARRRAQLETDIERREAERATLATEMNDPDFYLARKDADELIARYERLGREIDRLYNDLMKYEDGARAPRD
jgi:ATP-binding cassette, subfamily F, member 3